MKTNNPCKRLATAFIASIFAAAILVTGCNTGKGIKKDAEKAGDAIKEGIEEVADEIDDNT